MDKPSLGRATGDRPFPWVCPRCLEPTVHRRDRPYQARVKHDGLIHEVDVPALALPTCGKCGEELFDYRADEQIRDSLRAKLGLLTPAQIRRSRKALGLKQRQLAERLKIAPATISRWESGSVIQSGAMDNYLRTYFAFPDVRAALIGKGQDPGLGVGPPNEQRPNDCPSAEPTASSGCVDSAASLRARFPSAWQIHGERVNEIRHQVMSSRSFFSPEQN